MSLSESEIEQRLLSAPIRYSIVSWDGLTTSPCVFMDPEYGEFTAIFRYAISGKVKHPLRTKKLKAEASRRMNADPTNKEKIRAGIRRYDKKQARDRRKATMLDKYGVEHALQNADIMQKRNDTMVKKHGSLHYAKTEDFKERMSSVDMSKSIAGLKRAAAERVLTFSGNTMQVTAEKLNKAYSTFQSQVKKYGYDKAISITRKHTIIELVMKDLLHSLSVEFIEQYKVGNYIADFFIPKYNLLIEVDGLFWHSDAVLKDKAYHQKKRCFYDASGYISLFFRQDELLGKQEIIKSILTHKFGLSKRMFARKLSLSVLPNDKADAFFVENHLMGTCGGKTYGLMEGESIKAAMRIKRKGYTISIERYCTEKNTSIAGGFSRLLSHVMQEFSAKQIINFVDLRYGTGTQLHQIGFSVQSETISFKWTDSVRTFHRMRFPSNSGYAVGLAKIWDCGQRKFILQIA